MSETNQNVFAEQVRLMFGQTKKIIIGGLLSSLIFCVILWDVIAHAYVLAWLTLVICLLVLRGTLYLAYLRNQNKSLSLALWNLAYLLLTFTFSVAMGSVSAVIHFTDDTTYHFLIVTWLIGYSALALSAYAMSYRAVLAVFTPMLTMLIFSLVLTGSTLHLLVAAVILIWCFLVLNTMLPVNQSMIRAITLNHKLGLEIEQREILEEQLRQLSIRDSLTGLFNRRHFDNIYRNELKRAERGQTELSLMMVDIDCFKQFNDTYGHQAGDDCLRRVSEAIAQFVNRPGDLAARYGGEEIVVLLPNTNSEHSFLLAERMRSAVQDMAIPHRESVVVDTDTLSISIGVATAGPDSPKSKTDLLKRADDALYQAKGNGRNQTVVNTN